MPERNGEERPDAQGDTPDSGERGASDRAMENVEIAALLDSVADLLEIREANPFRVRAYRNAARTVETHAVPMRKLCDTEGALTRLPGIGTEMAKHIRELCETGQLTIYAELSREVPPSLIELMRLPGLGPKRARQLWDELGIETVDALEEAARAGEVARVSGFGEKTQAKILDGIEAYRRHTSRCRLAEADQLVRPLLNHLREAPGLERLEIAGSYRRRRETVGDLDLLAVSTTPSGIMERLRGYPAVVEVLAAGDTKTSVVLRGGVQVDLRAVPPESYGAALVYFTGSKAHNIRLRQRALDRGLRLSEYGVFRPAPEDDGEDGSASNGPSASNGSGGGPDDGEAAPSGEPVAVGERVAGATEEAVYEAVGLPWIAPELREDRGEIEAAERGELPRLLTLEDLRGDLQMHSRWSDGRHTVEEMLVACAALGHEYFAITDHSKALAMIEGLDEEKLLRQWEELEEVQARHPGIRILRSMEVDILQDGALDLSDEMLARLDLAVVSVHSFFGLPAVRQTDRILRALEHPSVDILAHPTGRIINRREPMEFEVDEVLRACAEHGVAVELNAQPDRLDLKDTHILRARELGVKVAISTDAHRIRELEFLRYGVEQARRAWLEPEDVLNARPAEALLASLRRARAS